jgi:hypothetical protein
MGQVVEKLTTVGLAQEEWDSFSAVYSYLKEPARVLAMEGVQVIKATWEARET